MKTKHFIALCLILSAGIFTNLSAQNKVLKTATFSVQGNCDMCKTRIEKAAKVPGVVKAVWDEKKKQLTVSHNPEKISTDSIQKLIAATGHDTPKYKADKKTYDKLPGCCKYRK